jgi:hypothetical protein
MKRKSILRIVYSLAGLGLIDVALRCYFTPDWKEGFSAAVHDPGKSFFHIFILPSIVYLLLTYWPKYLTGLSIKKNYLTITIFTLVIILAFGFTLNNARDNFFKNITTPEDIVDIDNLRSKMFKARNDQRKEVDEGNKIGETARKDFRIEAEKLIGFKKDSFWRYLKMASPRRHVATILSLCGAIVVAVILSVLVSLPFARNFRLSTEGREYVLVIILLLSLWFPLKVYSNWYHNFGFYPGDDEAIVISMFLLFACVVLVYTSSTPTVFFEISALVIMAISAILIIVAQDNSKIVNPVFSVISNLGRMSLSTIYAIIILSGVAILRSLNEKLALAIPPK